MRSSARPGAVEGVDWDYRLSLSLVMANGFENLGTGINT